MTNILFKLIKKLFLIEGYYKKLQVAENIIVSNKLSGLNFYTPSYFEKNKSLKSIFPNKVKKSFTSTKDYYNLIYNRNSVLIFIEMKLLT